MWGSFPGWGIYFSIGCIWCLLILGLNQQLSKEFVDRECLKGQSLGKSFLRQILKLCDWVPALSGSLRILDWCKYVDT